MNQNIPKSVLLFFLIIFSKVVVGQSLEEGFSDPPIEARPKGYWCLVNGNFSLSQMTEELKSFKAMGMGGVDIWDVSGWVDPNKVVPAGPAFMSDESVQAIAHGIRTGGELGLEMGLTISSSWNAGGDWVPPEDGVMGLFTWSADVEGAKAYNRQLPFPTIPETFGGKKMLLQKDSNGLPTFYKDVALLAFKVEEDSLISNSSGIVDLTGKYKNGVLNWNVPEGKWRIARYACTGTGQPLIVPSPNSNGLMIDHFNPEALKRHIGFFFKKLENELGDLSKTALKYLYTDSYEANSAVWTANMPEEFLKRRGYEMIPYLPALEGYVVSDERTTQRFLFDYSQTLSDLIIENHYALGTKLCNEKGLEFAAEAGGPGPPLHNTPFESLSSLGACTYPRGEFWFDPTMDQNHLEDLQIVKGPASAAHLYNRKRVEAEAFTGTQLWQFGPGDLKAAADRALCEGLTGFVYHTSPHVPREAGTPGWVYNFGTLINTTRAWWPKSANFHEYIARSCFLLQQGNFVGDVLYYYGDKAPNFVEPKPIEKELGFGYDYDVTNSDIILKRLDVKDGMFVLPHGQSYRILVLPDDEAINPKVLTKIAELARKGGIVVGNKPLRSHSLFEYQKNDALVQQTSSQMWTSKKSKIKYGNGWLYTKKRPIREVLEDVGIEPDIKVANEKQEKNLDFIHRQTRDEDIYFIRNKNNQPISTNVSLRSDRGAPEFWNPNDGSIQNQNIFSQEDGRTILPLQLEPYGSIFVIFRNGQVSNHIIRIESSGEEIFPIGNNQVAIAALDGKLILPESADYRLTYQNDSIKVINVKKDGDMKTIEGSWEIRFPFGWGAPRSIQFDQLIPWNESDNVGIKYFSGIAAYHKTFTLDKTEITSDLQLILDLGKVSKVADVYLNGKPLDILWHAPYKIDITEGVREGENFLMIEVANVMTNRMVGDAFREGDDKRAHSNITKGPNAWRTPYKDLSLVESGLLGPVTIKFSKTLDL